ncbi:MAG TPA: spore cortex-lytic enzyme [Ruminococcaceae bacterium]|nr:spore cortex-lytic enzyme [Oscillospiraceae bacterium]
MAFILKVCLIIALNIFIISLVSYVNTQNDTVTTLSRLGSRGTEVRQIQTKLKALGFYTSTVDGIFGSKTLDAVKRFQRSRGLTADGIVGQATLKALGLYTASAGSYSDNDYQLLARIISAESRGEPYSGQVAVGAVVLNRVEHPSFPNSIAGVIYQPGAFSAINDGQIHAEVTESSYRAAREALNGSDPSGGAIYYYNPAKTTNQWIRSRPVIKTIGSHLFCK